MNEFTEGKTVEPEVDTAALEEFVASIQHLPLFTGMAAQLVRSVEREDITTAELSRQISTDAALAVHLLRLVNSSYYGLSRRVGTVTEALAVLGLDLVRRVVTAAVLQRPLLAYLHDTQAAREFWRHQLVCAALARHLHGRKGQDGEVAYMAGLLHDVGRLVMLMHQPKDTEELLQRAGVDDDSSVETERKRFGFDHAQVGAALLELWGVPERMVQATHQHADVTEPEEPMAASVWHANRLAHLLVSEPDDHQDRPWVQQAGLTDQVCQQILDEVAAFEGDRG